MLKRLLFQIQSREDKKLMQQETSFERLVDYIITHDPPKGTDKESLEAYIGTVQKELRED